MLSSFRARKQTGADEQLLKLYSNRASVKRELNDLRRERHDFLDRLKDQEGEILRAQEQLDGLERLLTNPLAAANAMVYFQLRHLWRVGAQKVEQFGGELKVQREQRERAQLHESAIAKRNRRLGAIKEKLETIVQKQQDLLVDIGESEQSINSTNWLLRFFRAPAVRRKISSLRDGVDALQQKIYELEELKEKIQGEALPEPDGLSLESRRLINCAVIALAQHLTVHFSESDLIELTKESTGRPVGDMKFGDRRDCDRMVEQIRERIEDLRQETNLADEVRRRTNFLVSHASYRNETDSIPTTESVATTARVVPQTGCGSEAGAPETPLNINVLLEEYWDLYGVLC